MAPTTDTIRTDLHDDHSDIHDHPDEPRETWASEELALIAFALLAVLAYAWI